MRCFTQRGLALRLVGTNVARVRDEVASRLCDARALTVVQARDTGVIGKVALAGCAFTLVVAVAPDANVIGCIADPIGRHTRGVVDAGNAKIGVGVALGTVGIAGTISVHVAFDAYAARQIAFRLVLRASVARAAVALEGALARGIVANFSGGAIRGATRGLALDAFVVAAVFGVSAARADDAGRSAIPAAEAFDATLRF